MWSRKADRPPRRARFRARDSKWAVATAMVGIPIEADCKASAIVHEVQDPQLPSPMIAKSARVSTSAYSFAAARPSSPVRPQLRQYSTVAPSARSRSAQISVTQSQDRQSMSIRITTCRPSTVPPSGPGLVTSSFRVPVGSSTLTIASTIASALLTTDVACYMQYVYSPGDADDHSGAGRILIILSRRRSRVRSMPMPI